jgi:transcriptional regulator with XRE-family HTH domain
VRAALFHPPFDAALKSLLLSNLPTHTKAFAKKVDFEKNHIFEPTQKVIDTARFLRFNTKKFTNILIFDIDTFPSFDFKPSLSQMHTHFYNLTGFEPTWTLTTERGYHIALVLDEGIFNTHKDNKTPTNQYQTLLSLKQTISSLIDADSNASNRTHGIWRNPLTHKHIFTRKTYTFEALLYEMDIPLKKERLKFTTGQLLSNNTNLTMKKNPHNKILTAIEEGFYVSHRNKYLFAYGYKLLFENRSLEASLESQISQENFSYNDPLTSYEVKMITASILKFLPTMYTSTTIKQRGKLSNLMWKLNIHGTSQRRAFAGWHTSKERRTSTLKQITQSMIEAFDTGKTLSTSQIAAQIQKSKKTIQRYEQNYNLNSFIFMSWHKAQAKRATSTNNLNKIDIRPFVQDKVLRSLSFHFSEFTPSLTVQDKDHTRKIQYLKALYPLIA